jgi:hypothetical protein
MNLSQATPSVSTVTVEAVLPHLVTHDIIQIVNAFAAEVRTSPKAQKELTMCKGNDIGETWIAALFKRLNW